MLLRQWLKKTAEDANQNQRWRDEKD